MTRVSKYYICLVLVLLTFLSCKRTQKDGMLGPDLKVASSNFSELDPFKIYGVDKSSTSNPDTDIDLATYTKIELGPDPIDPTKTLSVIKNTPRNTYFKAKFNEVVRWKIEISSFSVDSLRSVNKLPTTLGTPYKTISGISDYIDSMPEWTWDGSSDNQYHFSPGKINFNFSVLGSKDTTRITRNLINSTILDSTNAILLNDFEGAGIVPYGDNKDKVSNPLPSLSTNFPLIPQGIKALSLFGTDHNGDYFVGGNTQPIAKGMLAGKSASDIYINAYIYGYPSNSGITPNATKIAIGISQDNVDGNGKFDAAYEDTFDQQISVDWVGWKLISVKYSNLKRSSSTDNGGNGPNKIQPETAVAVGCNILSSPNGSTVGSAIDHLIITFGKPLDK
ncbi:MAG: hypothetical protein H7329_18060 [Opitutaceae bacterium]|nr:hypothetical protein [Cytophagales bacterium]